MAKKKSLNSLSGYPFLTVQADHRGQGKEKRGTTGLWVKKNYYVPQQNLDDRTAIKPAHNSTWCRCRYGKVE